MPPMASTSTSTTARSTATSSGSARSSRRSTASSRRSKPFMASVTDTATADSPVGPTAPEPVPPESTALGAAVLGSVGDARPAAGQIVAVNLLPLALLAVGFLYLGKFESSLIGQQIESLRTQGEIFSAALGQGA